MHPGKPALRRAQLDHDGTIGRQACARLPGPARSGALRLPWMLMNHPERQRPRPAAVSARSDRAAAEKPNRTLAAAELC